MKRTKEQFLELQEQEALMFWDLHFNPITMMREEPMPKWESLDYYYRNYKL